MGSSPSALRRPGIASASLGKAPISVRLHPPLTPAARVPHPARQESRSGAPYRLAPLRPPARGRAPQQRSGSAVRHMRARRQSDAPRSPAPEVAAPPPPAVVVQQGPAPAPPAPVPIGAAA